MVLLFDTVLAAKESGGLDGATLGFVVPIIVAVVGAIGLVIVNMLRKPVGIQDLWAENRSLRAELEGTDKRIERLQRSVVIARLALNVLYIYVERLQGIFKDDPKMLPMTETTKEAVEGAQKDTIDNPV